MVKKSKNQFDTFLLVSIICSAVFYSILIMLGALDLLGVEVSEMSAGFATILLVSMFFIAIVLLMFYFCSFKEDTNKVIKNNSTLIKELVVGLIAFIVTFVLDILLSFLISFEVNYFVIHIFVSASVTLFLFGMVILLVDLIKIIRLTKRRIEEINTDKEI